MNIRFTALPRLMPVLLAGALAACAGGGEAPTAALANAGYTLSAEEQGYNCKQLTGRMQIRILEIRDYNGADTATLASRTLKTGTQAVFGGSSAKTNSTAAAYARDRAMLDAYNRQLAAKGCNTFDLDAELQQTDFRVTPAASVKVKN